MSPSTLVLNGSSPRARRVRSVSDELIKKSAEAALAAVQIFNSPTISFKAETYTVMMMIAWTYLMHAYYRKNGIEYRYYDLSTNGKRRIFSKTKHGAFKYWELERCLNNDQSPIDKDAANNLRFLVALRHEIEHQMTTRIDDLLSARFQACCLNYNEYLKKLMGHEQGIDRHLAFSLQFSSISSEHVNMLSERRDLPGNIYRFIEGFDGALPDEEFNSSKFAYRVLFVAKTANNKGQADQVIEFIKADSDIAESVNKQYAVIKETERKKYLPAQIVSMLQDDGYGRFSMNSHTDLWKSKNAKDPKANLGVQIVKQWYWYDRWLEIVRTHCKENAEQYK